MTAAHYKSRRQFQSNCPLPFRPPPPSSSDSGGSHELSRASDVTVPCASSQRSRRVRRCARGAVASFLGYSLPSAVRLSLNIRVSSPFWLSARNYFHIRRRPRRCYSPLLSHSSPLLPPQKLARGQRHEAGSRRNGGFNLKYFLPCQRYLKCLLEELCNPHCYHRAFKCVGTGKTEIEVQNSTFNNFTEINILTTFNYVIICCFMNDS